jgi:hypothetical protein
MTATKDFTPIGTDYTDLAELPEGITFLGTREDGKVYEFTIAELQSISGWSGTGTEGGGTGDVLYEDLESTESTGGAGLIALGASLSADLGDALNVHQAFEYFRDNALLAGDADDPPEADDMPASAAFVIYYPETGAYGYVMKGAVELSQGTSQGNAVIVTDATYTIGAADTRVTGDSSSAQTFTLPSTSVDRPLTLPLRVRRSGAGTVTVVAPAGVTLNGASAGEVDIGDRFTALEFDQISAGRWECSGTATATTPTDVVAPTAVTFFPADGATNVPIGVVPYVEFSEPVALGTGNVVIRDNDGGFADLYTYDVATDTGTSAGDVNVSNTRLTIYPDAALANGIEHAIRIAGTCIDDLAGNSYAGIANDTTWSFTTVAASVSNVTIVTSGKFSTAAGSGDHVEAISGLAENDVLYVAEACDAQIFDGIISGFSPVYSAVDSFHASLWVGRKVQTSSPDTSITVPRHSTMRKAVVWWAVRGANANIDGTATEASGAGSTGNPNSPAYTQTNANAMPFTVAAQDDHNVVMSAPSGWTILQSMRSESSLGSERTAVAVAYQAVSATAGTVHDPGAWTGSATGAWRAITFAQH